MLRRRTNLNYGSVSSLSEPLLPSGCNEARAPDKAKALVSSRHMYQKQLSDMVDRFMGSLSSLWHYLLLPTTLLHSLVHKSCTTRQPDPGFIYHEDILMRKNAFKRFVTTGISYNTSSPAHEAALMAYWYAATARSFTHD